MNHQESQIQQACIAAFRAKYPWASKLLIHVKNEEAGGRVAGAIHKAEGVVAGAPDLLLLIPSSFLTNEFCPYLCIEMKSEEGRKRDSQLLYRTYVQSVGSFYIFCYSLEQFLTIADEYMKGVPEQTRQTLMLAYRAEEAEHIRKAREELKKAQATNPKPRRKKSVTEARNQLKAIINKPDCRDYDNKRQNAGGNKKDFPGK